MRSIGSVDALSLYHRLLVVYFDEERSIVQKRRVQTPLRAAQRHWHEPTQFLLFKGLVFRPRACGPQEHRQRQTTKFREELMGLRFSRSALPA